MLTINKKLRLLDFHQKFHRSTYTRLCRCINRLLKVLVQKWKPYVLYVGNSNQRQSYDTFPVTANAYME